LTILFRSDCKQNCHYNGESVRYFEALSVTHLMWPTPDGCPIKRNADRRHHIPRMTRRVTNWLAYEAGLRSRESLTLWITPQALAQWQAPRRTTPGWQPRSPALAIEVMLTPGSAFQMRLRQTEGLAGSVIDLTGLTVAIPDHTTLSRRGQKTPGDQPGTGVRGSAAHAGRQHRRESVWRGQVA
jgi:hypothetical protein